MIRLFNALKSHYLSPIEIRYITMPGGEPHPIIETHYSIDNENIVIDWRWRDSFDIGVFLTLVDIIKRNKPRSITLFIPYFPGGRQDRVTSYKESFTAIVFADLINNLSLDKVVTFDAHSDVTPALIRNCVNISPEQFIRHELTGTYHKIISPDAGALKRSRKVAELYSVDVIQCSKNRNTKTGEITDIHVPDLGTTTKFLLVDDICDGGATFVKLMEVIRERYKDIKVDFWASHGIFSKGLSKLFEYFDNIYTTDSLEKASNLQSVITSKQFFVHNLLTNERIVEELIYA